MCTLMYELCTCIIYLHVCLTSCLRDNYIQLVVIYNDHSLYTWDLKNLSQIGKVYSCLYHNACIWDISVSHVTPSLPLSLSLSCALSSLSLSLSFLSLPLPLSLSLSPSLSLSLSPPPPPPPSLPPSLPLPPPSLPRPPSLSFSLSD